MRKAQLNPTAVMGALVLTVVIILLSIAIYNNNVAKLDEYTDFLHDCGDGLLAQAVAPSDGETKGMCFSNSKCEFAYGNQEGIRLLSNEDKTDRAKIRDKVCPVELDFGLMDQDNLKPNDLAEDKFWCTASNRDIDWLYTGSRGCEDPAPFCCIRISDNEREGGIEESTGSSSGAATSATPAIIPTPTAASSCPAGTCTQGDTRCSSSSNRVESCGPVPATGCPEWGGASDCRTNEVCQEKTTSNPAKCIITATPSADECVNNGDKYTPGETSCFGNIIKTCLDSNKWSYSSTDCSKSGRVCDEAAGIAECINN